jgi:hypothetical protein
LDLFFYENLTDILRWYNKKLKKKLLMYMDLIPDLRENRV